jgi:hypothetical protein
LWLVALSEPEVLWPSLLVLAVLDPVVLWPPLAVFAVRVPPVFGVLTGGVFEGGVLVSAEPCWPAWLWPPLASLEIAAPLSTPVDGVVCARPEIVVPLLSFEGDGVDGGVLSPDPPRTFGWVSA